MTALHQCTKQHRKDMCNVWKLSCQLADKLPRKTTDSTPHLIWPNFGVIENVPGTTYKMSQLEMHCLNGTVIRRILASETWHQDKKFLAEDLDQLHKIKMQQVMVVFHTVIFKHPVESTTLQLFCILIFLCLVCWKGNSYNLSFSQKYL